MEGKCCQRSRILVLGTTKEMQQGEMGRDERLCCMAKEMQEKMEEYPAIEVEPQRDSKTNIPSR